MTSPFGRPTLFVASFHKPTSMALSKFIKLFLGEKLPHYFPNENFEPLLCAEDLHTRLDSLLRRDLLDAVCVVDLTTQHVFNWNITKYEGGLCPSELVLLYPEVYWIFLVNNENNKPKYLSAKENNPHFVISSDLSSLISLVQRHANDFRTWFDPSGLRRVVRNDCGFLCLIKADEIAKRQKLTAEDASKRRKLVKELVSKFEDKFKSNGNTTVVLIVQITIEKTTQLTIAGFNDEGGFTEKSIDDVNDGLVRELREEKPDRMKSFELARSRLGCKIPPPYYGAAIDDEDDFVILNGFVLYRNHYATYVINSFNEMKNTLCDKVDFSVVMEDVELNFYDNKNATKKEKESLYTSKKEGQERNEKEVLGNRNSMLKVQKNALRFIISSASNISGNFKVTWEENNEKENTEYITITKPYGGIYDRKLEILRQCFDEDIKDQRKRETDVSGHSIGDSRSQHVADSLIDRARIYAKDANTTESAIHVALLAFDARRLLRGECLALSLEALAIQHKMEVMAECAFIGTATKLDVKARLDSIEKSVGKLVGTDRNSKYKKYQAMIEIADELRQVYRNFDQFIEEEEAIKEVRKYEWKLKYCTMQPGATCNNIGTIMKFIPSGVPAWYFNHVVSELLRMVCCVVIWIFAFAVIYSTLLPFDSYGHGYDSN